MFLNELERTTRRITRPLLLNESGYYSQIDRRTGSFLIRHNQMLIRPYRYVLYGTVVAAGHGSRITAQYQMRHSTRRFFGVMLFALILSAVTMLLFGFPARTLFNALLILGFAVIFFVQYRILVASKGSPEEMFHLISQAAGQVGSYAQ